MKRWRVLFALTGLGLWAGFARANDPPAGIPVPVLYPGGTLVPEPAEPPLTGPAEHDARQPGPARSWWQRLGPRSWFPWLQEPSQGLPGQVVYPHSQVAPPPATPPTVVGPAQYVPPNYPALPYGPDVPRPHGTCLQRFGVGCWSHHNCIGCSSLRSTLTFYLGSCRAFFGEPCMHGAPGIAPAIPMPPPNLAPYGVLNAPGYPTANLPPGPPPPDLHPHGPYPPVPH